MIEETDRLPGSVFPPRYVRILKFAVASMTALLVAGIVALVLMWRGKYLRSVAKPAAAASAQAPYLRSVDLGRGKLESVAAGGGLIILHWNAEASDIVLVIDPQDGREIGRIQVPHR